MKKLKQLNKRVNARTRFTTIEQNIVLKFKLLKGRSFNNLKINLFYSKSILLTIL